MVDWLRLQKQDRLSYLALAAILLAGAWLRWRYIAGVQPYPDEFATLLAVRSILDRGLPVLPSGLFYEHGLLFSYAGALAAWLFGYSRDVVRLVSLVFGLGSIGLVFYLGRRWFSPLAGLAAALGLAVAPAAVLWGGRARMYALLQFLVLLLVFAAVEGARQDKPRWRWLALGLFLAALLTQFVSLLLAPALLAALIAAAWLAGARGRPAWFRRRAVIWEGLALAAASLIGVLVKRAGQPAGIEPLAADNAVAGVGQVLSIYSDLGLDVAQAWRSIAPFFVAPEALLLTGLALIALAWLLRSLPARASRTPQLFTTLALGLLLILTTAEVLLIAPPDRLDEKYLFMLLPVLLLLAGQGLQLAHTFVETRASGWPSPMSGLKYLSVLALIAIVALAAPATADLLADPGENYDAAFGYVRDHWQPGDAVLTGTPAAAALYLNRNDYYAVQAGGRYDYRILRRDGQAVERWLGSPWINDLAELNRVLSSGRVWLVLERWGLLIEYYEPFFMQNILAQTEFVREDNGVIVLRSRPEPLPLAAEPAHPVTAVLGDAARGSVRLLGYTLEPESLAPGQTGRLTLYWQAEAPLPADYTVFVHLRAACQSASPPAQAGAEPCPGPTVVQADHRPLGSVYPTTLWPAGQVIRETVELAVPAGLEPGGEAYRLWVGMYQLETLERLPVQDDRSGENAVLLGEVLVR